MQIENNAPIYIGGPDRCGKTTLAAFLSSHPRIAIPVIGSNFWSYFYGQFGDLSKETNFERCLDAMLHYKHALFLQPDPDRIRREFWQGIPSYARLFALFHAHFAEAAGKSRWGDQTGLVERYADEIITSYPAVKMLHMIRDPRDRYEASLAMWPDGKGRAGVAAARWLYSATLAMRNEKKYPHQYKTIRFETMVERPVETLQEVCEFLGEEYTPQMLLMENAPGHRAKLQPEETENRPVDLSTDFIGQYKNNVPKEEIAFLQTSLHKQMQFFGYKNDKIQFTPKKNLKYLLSIYPANLARMRFWLLREKLQHSFPAQIGRRPSRSMLIPQKSS